MVIKMSIKKSKKSKKSNKNNVYVFIEKNNIKYKLYFKKDNNKNIGEIDIIEENGIIYLTIFDGTKTYKLVIKDIINEKDMINYKYMRFKKDLLTPLIWINKDAFYFKEWINGNESKNPYIYDYENTIFIDNATVLSWVNNDSYNFKKWLMGDNKYILPYLNLQYSYRIYNESENLTNKIKLIKENNTNYLNIYNNNYEYKIVTIEDTKYNNEIAEEGEIRINEENEIYNLRFYDGTKWLRAVLI